MYTMHSKNAKQAMSMFYTSARMLRQSGGRRRREMAVVAGADRGDGETARAAGGGVGRRTSWGGGRAGEWGRGSPGRGTGRRPAAEEPGAAAGRAGQAGALRR